MWPRYADCHTLTCSLAIASTSDRVAWRIIDAAFGSYPVRSVDGKVTSSGPLGPEGAMHGLAMSRVIAFSWGLGLVLVAASPILRNPRDDGFPLSTFPMFAEPLAQPTFYSAE